MLPIDLENAYGRLFVPRAWKRPGLHAHSLQRFARCNGSPVTRGSGSDATMVDCPQLDKGRVARITAMQVMFVLGFEFALSSQTSWLRARS